MLVASGVPADAADHHGQKAVFYAAVARSKPCVAAIAAATPNFKRTPERGRPFVLQKEDFRTPQTFSELGVGALVQQCESGLEGGVPSSRPRRSTPDAAKVKLLLEGRRVQHDDDDDVGDGWGGCFGASGPGCF